MCFDEPGMKAILPSSLRRGEMALAGKSNAEFNADRKQRTHKGEVGPAAPGVSYMVSDYNYIFIFCI